MTSHSLQSLNQDKRAVTPIIAFILLFGIAVVAFSGYQATTVPDQNAETEFQHSQDVRDDMVGLYSGVLQAGEGERQFRSIKLGTQYRERLLAFNPPPPTGTIETNSPVPIELNPIGGTLNTRSLTYSPNYNELPASSTVYDTSTLFTNPQSDDGNPIIHEEQALIDDDEVRLVALQNEFDRSGSERASVNFNPAREEALNVNERVFSNLYEEDQEFSIDIPTQLGEEFWSDSIEGAFEEADAWAVDESSTPNTLTLEFDESRTLYVNTVGVGQRPVDDPANLISAILVSDLNIAGQGEEATITEGDDEDVSVVVENVGEQEGTFDVTLEITPEDDPENGFNAIELDESTAELSSGETDTVTWEDVTDDFDAGDYDVEVSTKDDSISGDLTVVEEGQADLNIGDFSGELPDGETDPVDLEDVEVTIDERANFEAENVDVTVDVFNDGGDGELIGSDDVTSETIAADGEATFTFFEDDSSIDGLGADTYDVEVTVTADNANGDDRTESFTVEEPEVDSVDAEFDNAVLTEGEENTNDLTVTILDQTGDPIDGQEVSLEIIEGDGSFDETILTTDGDGEAIATYAQGVDDTAGDTIEVEADADGVTDTATYDVVEPAESELSNLQIAGQGDDATITAGNKEDVDVDVTNIGDQDGAVDVTLEITPEAEEDPAYEETEEGFTVTAGDTETLTFTEVTGDLDADDYVVSVETDDDDIEGGLTVEPAEPDSVEVEPFDDTATADGEDELSYTATVTDAFGNTIEGVTVVTSTENGEDIEFDGDDNQETDADGEVEVTVTSTTAQEDVIFTFEEQENNNDATADGTFEAGDVDTVDAEFTEEEVAAVEGNENELTVTVTDANDNRIEGEDVTLSVESGTGTLDETTVTTDQDGEATTTYTQGADDTAGDIIEVESDADSVTDTATYDVVGTMADQVTFTAEDGTNNPSFITFDIEADENAETAHPDDNIVITGISVDPTDADANSIDNGDDAEFFSESGDQEYLNDVITIGDPPTSLDTDPSLAQGENEEYRLEEFVDDDGGSVNMNNEEVTVVLVFQDGSELEVTETFR